MKGLRQKLVWIAPVSVLLIGILVLYITNLQRFTEQPSENWSREISVGTLDAYYTPSSEVNGEEIEVYFVQAGEIIKKTFDQSLKLKDTEKVSTNAEGFNDYHVKGDRVYIYDNEQIILASTNEVMDENVSLFVPSEDGSSIYYSKEQTLFELVIETGEINEVTTLTHPIRVLKNKGRSLLAYDKMLNEADVTLFNLDSGIILEEHLEVGVNEQVVNVLFDIENDNLHFGLHVETQSNRNKQLKMFVTKTPLTNPELNLLQIHPLDPITNAPLRGFDDFQLKAKGEKTEILFRGIGFTYKETKENEAYNIYSAIIDGEKISTERLSNTYHVSTDPFYISEDTIGWLEPTGGSKNNIFIASQKSGAITTADQKTFNEYLVAFGMCIAMIASSIFIIYILIPWLIAPVLYITILSLIRGKNRFNSTEKPIFFYAGILVYLVGAFIFRGQLFPDSALLHAPSFVKFEGSDVVLILIFALISFLITQVTSRDWTLFGKYTYFVSLQFLLYILIVGPYYF